MRKRKIWQGLIGVSALLSPLFIIASCSTPSNPNNPSNGADNPAPSTNTPAPGDLNPGIANVTKPVSVQSLNNFTLVHLDKYSRKVNFWFHAQNQNSLKAENFYVLLNNTTKVNLLNGLVSYRVYNGTFEVPNTVSKVSSAQIFYEDTNSAFHSLVTNQTVSFKTDNLGEVEITPTKFSKDNKKQEDIFPTDLKIEDIELSVSGGNSANYNYQIKEIDYFLDQKGKNISDWLGAVNLIITFTNKTNPQEVFTRSKIVTGFKFNPIDGQKNDQYNKNDEQSHEHLNHDYVMYSKLNHQQRYEIDNVLYLNAIMSHLEFKGISPLEYRLDLNINANKEAILQYDAKAKSLGLDTYQSSYIKGFTLPKYSTSGEFLGLSLQEGAEIEKGPERADSIGRFQWRYSGLARTLVNNHYKNAATQTYSVEFTNPKDGSTQSSAGTMWILDYQLSEDGKYPTKWYFGTNLHVADNFTKQTRNISVSKLKNSADLNRQFSSINTDINFERFTFRNGVAQSLVKKVYEGKNFLSTKPADYLTAEQKVKYGNLEEFVDFAILEFDFSVVTSDNVWAYDYSINAQSNLDYEYDSIKNNPEEFAKLITNDYANKTEKHIKFLKTSYLADYKQIDRDLISTKETAKTYQGNELYAVGYPLSYEDYFFLNEDGSGARGNENWLNRTDTYSLWTNSNPEFYWHKDEYNEDYKNLGNYLSSSIGYRTFTNKPGIADAFLTATHTGSDFYVSGNDKLIGFGLNYLPKQYVPYGGASGSSFRNQYNELVGVFHSGNSAARTGLLAAFRSEGFNYQGLFGDYNLPQYDLIYGGGKDQINSYRESLAKLYPTAKTNLFPSGLNTVPEDFKFKN